MATETAVALDSNFKLLLMSRILVAVEKNGGIMWWSGSNRWRHNLDHDRRPLSLPLQCDRVTPSLHDALGQIKAIAEVLKLWKRFMMWQISFEQVKNSLPFVCLRGYGNLSTLSIAIPRLAFGRACYGEFELALKNKYIHVSYRYCKDI